MPITTVDPVTALIVVDLQRGLLGLPTAHPIADVIARAAELAAAFRRRGAPVVLVTVAGSAPGRTDARRPPFTPPPEALEIVPALDAQPTDLRVTKYTWGAFHGTPLDLHLRRRGVTQVVVCGVATSAGVESTARAAHEHGYHVTLPIDAMTDPVAEAHAHTLARIFPRLGETGTTAELLAALSGLSR